MSTRHGEKRNLTNDILWASSGQQVIQDGHAISYQELIAMVAGGLFYDLNHVISFPWVTAQDFLPNKVFVQVGYRDLLSHPGGQGIPVPHPHKVQMALNGEPVVVDIGPNVWATQCRYSSQASFMKDMLEWVDNCGYKRTEGPPNEIGEYCIQGDTLTIRFLPGIYPHNLLGVSQRGRVVLMQVTFPRGGKMVGNRSAMTVVGTAQAALTGANHALATYGDTLKDCLILDNGGDVMLWGRESNGGWERRVESELRREAIRSLVALVAQEHIPLPHTDIWPAEDLLKDAKWEGCANGSVLIAS